MQFASATLGGATQIGLTLLVLHCPGLPKQVAAIITGFGHLG
jgi:hypothetical protein